jgi:hypothetical protein
LSDVFRVHALPAQRGDCLWLEYGPAGAPRHVLIDGGIKRTGREALRRALDAAPKPLVFELFIITHIDLDHIQGAVELIKDLPAGVSIKEVWFNGLDQIRDPKPPGATEELGVAEGIELSDLLKTRHAEAWNSSAKGRAISLDPTGKVVHHALEGGMAVTVLAPSAAQLGALRDEWQEVLEAFGADQAVDEQDAPPAGLNEALPDLEPMGALDVAELAQSAFKEDRTIPNGSSIATLFEFAGRRALMLADAHPSVVVQSLSQLAPDGRCAVDLVKLAHHGSRNNTNQALAQALSAPTWLFSSNGASNTKHPHPEAVARVLHHVAGAKTLVFNYKTSFNDMWDDAELKAEHEYSTVYGDGETAVVVDLMAAR